ncbi:acyltransferase family protein [Herbiconiux sp. L3-i23]|uniref:acyltransferase family protein n=1 Tax=Herbiconiux sp. L3-i23 TaxID=2905871 RepID=UPI0020602E33|nr:acyltransferase family protein [Herbiconiux sp. L3-i23]BDI23290.1 acetyltransferase fucose-4-O-acetylase [Herbiconiux sp. L3-i23]
MASPDNDAGTDSVAGTATKRRIPLWDNARFAAIFLVVVGHAILRLTPADGPASVLYLVVYQFHIPLLVLVSGYFAKSSLGRRELTRIVTDIAIPYFVFETIWTIVQWLVEGNDVVNYANPSWTLWFLLALIGWRLLLPVLAVTRFPLAAAALISIGAGYLGDIDQTFAISRMLGLLPFFVLGWRLRTWEPGGRTLTSRWDDASRRGVIIVRVVAAALFAVVIVATALQLETWRDLKIRRFLLFDEAYPFIGYDEWWAGLVRLAVLLLGAVLSVAFLTLLPRRTTWFTGFGSATMYVYLLHTFFLYPLRETGFIEDNASTWLLVVLLALSFGITVLLSTAPVRRLLRPLVEPRPNFLLGPER